MPVQAQGGYGGKTPACSKSTLKDCGWSAPIPAHLTRRKDPILVLQEAGWASGPVWSARKISPPPRYDPRTVQPVASRCTSYVKTDRIGNVLVRSVYQY